MTVHETRALEVFCTLCFRGDLTQRGKVNLLDDLHRRYPQSGYGELAHTLRMFSTLTVEEREALFKYNLDIFLRRAG